MTATVREANPTLAQIYEAEVSFVWKSLRRLGVPEADLEDVTHDLFIAVQKKLPDLDPARPVRPWLFGFAYRFASDYRRSGRARRERLEDVGEVADSSPTADEKLSTREAHALILAGLEALTLDARAVFVMHDLDGCSMPEIAEVLGVGLNTLYSRLRLARARFTDAVRQLQKEAPGDVRR
ncbi:MAG TPA: sigma-70 family RNA polymerase sigma factor [Polyangia bacterium]|nr:sigma-70 family RNA polymerase sigma factor [Polyangia bacterium]